MKALILAAGHGTRLRHLTAARPKPMLPLDGRPLLAHTIAWLRGHGVRQIAINLHHHAGCIVETFGDGARWGVTLQYSFEPHLLGTAGAAKRLAHFLDEPFVVAYGDVYTNLDLGRMQRLHATHRAAQAPTADEPCLTDACLTDTCLIMALYAVPNPEACGLVELDAARRVRRFVEKPPPAEVFTDQAFSGVMICDPGVLEEIPAETPFDFGHDLFPRLLARQAPLYGEPLAAGEFVIDIGTLDGYLAALRMAARQPALPI